MIHHIPCIKSLLLSLMLFKDSLWCITTSWCAIIVWFDSSWMLQGFCRFPAEDMLVLPSSVWLESPFGVVANLPHRHEWATQKDWRRQDMYITGDCWHSLVSIGMKTVWKWSTKKVVLGVFSFSQLTVIKVREKYNKFSLSHKRNKGS